MKKILIMMALIVGFGVSAQDTKIRNVRVNPFGDDVQIEWNTQRARFVKWKKEAWGPNRWKHMAKPPKGNPYIIHMPKTVIDKTYQIFVEGRNQGTKPNVKTEVLKEIRVIKIEEIIVNDGESYGILVKTDIDKSYIGKKVFVGSQKHKGTIIEIENNAIDSPFKHTFLTIRFNRASFKLIQATGDFGEYLDYLWFKQ